MRLSLSRISEPLITLGYNQAVEDPRDGLTLFGPLDYVPSYGIRYGAIGTDTGLRRFEAWIRSIQAPILSEQRYGRPFYPGFEAVFRTALRSTPDIKLVIDEAELRRRVHQKDRYQRVYSTVDLYEKPLVDAANEDERVDLWFVVIPDEVYQFCRPKSVVRKELQVVSERPQTVAFARSLKLQRPLLEAESEYEVSRAYEYEVHFHNQLKARMLKHQITTQIVRESTLDPEIAVRKRPGWLSDMRSSIAWNLTTTMYYKNGWRPWKLEKVREGVCYVGLVFKKMQDENHANACCAAQMFLDSGDGVVFKGAVGPWYNEDTGQYHLCREDAAELISTVLKSYRSRTGRDPKELFIHGRVRFDDAEWSGFKDGAGDNTMIVGVRIQGASDLKVFRDSSYPLLRGMAYVRDERTAYLWTKGFIPRLRTYPGKEVPNPLLIDVCRGTADIEVVLKDILGLTKLNYNACMYGDGVPVTLRFADAVGEILTAGPTDKGLPLPFRYYI